MLPEVIRLAEPVPLFIETWKETPYEPPSATIPGPGNEFGDSNLYWIEDCADMRAAIYETARHARACHMLIGQPKVGPTSHCLRVNLPGNIVSYEVEIEPGVKVQLVLCHDGSDDKQKVAIRWGFIVAGDKDKWTAV